MKKILVFMLLLTGPVALIAQSEKYEQAMRQALASLDTTSGEAGMSELAVLFERISAAEPYQWLPAYYGAYVNVMLSFQTNDPVKKDAILDKAESL